MSNMTLRLSAPDAADFPVGDVVARVQGYPGKDNSTPFYREVLIPASDEGTRLYVDPGRYRIQALLPSGSILQEDRTVRPGQQVFVNFTIPRNRSKTVDAADSALRGASSESAGPFHEFQLHMREIPRPLSWQWTDELELNDLLSSYPGYLQGVVDLRPSAKTGIRSFEIHAPWLGDDYSSTFSVVVQYADRLELAGLPLPWTLQSGTKAPVNLIFNGDPDNRNARTSIVVNDPQLDGLLAYLGRGNLGPAGAIFQHLDYDSMILRAIVEKQRNPLAACAAAYVGLAVFEVDQPERWDAWLPNIARFFPKIPDGAIVHARRIINRPKYPAEKDEALQALKSAFHAGIPYFTAGLLLLRDSLMLFASIDDEAKQMLGIVSQFASRVDPSQVFTVLQYPRSR